MKYTIQEIEEKLDNLETIYWRIADLRDYVDETDYIEREYIKEKLEEMQRLCN